VKDAVLVTGGAGYIGSHTVRRLLEGGRKVIVADDLSTGHSEVIALFSHVYGPDRFAYEAVNLLDREAIRRVFERHEVVGIVDFAARIAVGDSQKNPREYFENNVLAFRNLIGASPGVPLVKSSTAATYGNPDAGDVPLCESYPERVVSSGAFPRSQLMPADVDFETLLRWFETDVVGERADFALSDEDIAFLRIATSVYGVTKSLDERLMRKLTDRQTVALRYFNAAGADPSRLMGEDHRPETHLIPVVVQVALGQREFVEVFGDDYPTPDGTAIRDYISVAELADAHVLALDYLLRGGDSQTFNLGTGNGFSVREIIGTARRVTGHPIPERISPRRSGDPAVLVADATRIREELGWQATQTLDEIVESAWHWHRLNPFGYRVAQEERYNPFWDRWVNVAAQRRNRPWRGETQDLESEETRSYDPHCYLCPGNRRANGSVNEAYTGVWAFRNDFPTLTLDSYETDATFGPYKSRSSRGVAEVLNYSPHHSKRLSTMSVEEIAVVVDAWADITKRLGGDERIRYVLIYENRGTVMGNSQPHPHGQIYAYGEIPDLIVKPQIGKFRRYRQETGGGCFVCDAVAAELDDRRRVLVNHPGVVAFVPYAAQFPYDVMIVPREHVALITETGSQTRREIATALKRVLVGLDGLFDAPYHYSLALVQAPTDGRDYGYHLQIHITSLLAGPGVRKHVVGADIFGQAINPSDPNETAEEIRYRMRRLPLS
jgi:UDP-glucose 4-epimerase